MKDLVNSLRRERSLDDEGLRTLLESKDTALTAALTASASV